MTDLDELRRIAYGRTTSADEESAAARARVELAAREVVVVEEAPVPEPTPEPDDDFPLSIIEPDDEPGYLRRLAASWRVWAVPAFAAFVIGIALAAASGVLIFNSMRFGDGSSAITPGTNTSERFLEGSTVLDLPEPIPGNVKAANARLAEPQQPEDVPDPAGAEVLPESTRLIYASPTERAYAGSSPDYPYCLLLTDLTMGQTSMTCSSEENFELNSMSITVSQSITQKFSVLWDGAAVTMSRTTE
jgi:hypothetical protein